MINSPTGLALSHAQISNPVVESGNNIYRALKLSHNDQSSISYMQAHHQVQWLATSPAYDSLSHSTHTSLRAKIRIDSNTFSALTSTASTWYAYQNAGLVAYSDISTDGEISFTTAQFGSGYGLFFQRRIVPGTTSTEEFYLGIFAEGNKYAQSASNRSATFLLTTCSGTYTYNTWYDIRFDLVPTSLTEKNLIAYTSSDNGATWDQVGFYTITSAHSKWKSTGYPGLRAYSARYDYGIRPGPLGVNVDNFKIYLQEISGLV